MTKERCADLGSFEIVFEISGVARRFFRRQIGIADDTCEASFDERRTEFIHSRASEAADIGKLSSEVAGFDEKGRLRTLGPTGFAVRGVAAAED